MWVVTDQNILFYTFTYDFLKKHKKYIMLKLDFFFFLYSLIHYNVKTVMWWYFGSFRDPQPAFVKFLRWIWDRQTSPLPSVVQRCCCAVWGFHKHQAALYSLQRLHCSKTARVRKTRWRHTHIRSLRWVISPSRAKMFVMDLNVLLNIQQLLKL